MRIAIVGAGPAGATAALCLARQKRHDVVLLDRDLFPRLKTCGSVLSPRCIALCDELALAPTMQPIAHGLRALRLTGPTGRASTLRGSDSAWVIPRARFDAELVRAAERAGARFEQGFDATQALRDPAGRIRGVSDGAREIEADLTLFADGASARFSEDRRAKRHIATIMGWWEGVAHLPDQMEIWFDRRVAPWYGWLFPETRDRVNIGILHDPLDPSDPKEILGEILERQVGDRLKGARLIREHRSAPIVYAEQIGPIAAPGALWLGEAARLTNAATGEGIFHAMKSAAIATDAITRHEGGAALGHAYESAIRRSFNARMRLAIALMRFAGTPAFSWMSSLISLPSVEKGVLWTLGHV